VLVTVYLSRHSILNVQSTIQRLKKNGRRGATTRPLLHLLSLYRMICSFWSWDLSSVPFLFFRQAMKFLLLQPLEMENRVHASPSLSHTRREACLRDRSMAARPSTRFFNSLCSMCSSFDNNRFSCAASSYLMISLPKCKSPRALPKIYLLQNLSLFATFWSL
jgi:hypothetical protein